MIPMRVIIGEDPTNQVPSVTPKMRTLGESSYAPHKARAWILDECSYGGLKDWPKKGGKQARELLVKWAHLFACSDLDLKKTSLTKHNIELTDRTTFKQFYHQIPSHMYEDVKAHPWEMLDISSIQTLYSQWASSVVSVQKGWEPKVLHQPQETKQPDCQKCLLTTSSQ